MDGHKENDNSQEITRLNKEISQKEENIIRLNGEISQSKREIDQLNEKISQNEKEITRLNKARRLWSIACILLVLVLISAGAACYILFQERATLNAEVSRLNQEISRSNENIARNEQARKILSALNSDSNVRKFYASGSLVCADYIYGTNKFDRSGNRIAGNLSMPVKFCEDFSNSPSEYGFFNRNGLKSALESLRHGDFMIRNSSKFICETDTKRSFREKFDILSVASFFSLKSLNPGKGAYIAGLEENISDVLRNHSGEEITFRFFFATSERDLYVMSTIKGNKLSGCYLVSDYDLFRRDLFLRDLQENLTQKDFDTGGADIEFLLQKPEIRLLDGGLDFDSCIDIFISQLTERSRAN